MRLELIGSERLLEAAQPVGVKAPELRRCVGSERAVGVGLEHRVGIALAQRLEGPMVPPGLDLDAEASRTGVERALCQVQQFADLPSARDPDEGARLDLRADRPDRVGKRTGLGPQLGVEQRHLERSRHHLLGDRSRAAGRPHPLGRLHLAPRGGGDQALHDGVDDERLDRLHRRIGIARVGIGHTLAPAGSRIARHPEKQRRFVAVHEAGTPDRLPQGEADEEGLDHLESHLRPGRGATRSAGAPTRRRSPRRRPRCPPRCAGVPRAARDTR